MEAAFLESEEFKQHMSVQIQNHIIREDLKMHNFLVEKCFSHCVDKFRRKSLDRQEESCVKRCAEKYLNHSLRVNMRFGELNQGSPTTPDNV